MSNVDYSETIWEVIDVLEWSKWKHDQTTDDKCGIFYGQGCDCGADEVNEMYDTAISNLKALLG